MVCEKGKRNRATPTTGQVFYSTRLLTPIPFHNTNLIMAAMMPGPGSGRNQTANPYDHYDAPIEDNDDDLIDPDDGMYSSYLSQHHPSSQNMLTRYLWCSHSRRPRRPLSQQQQHQRPRSSNRQHHLSTITIQCPNCQFRSRLPQQHHRR